MPRKKIVQPHQAEKIIEGRRAGVMFKEIAAEIGIPVRTARNWHYKRLMKIAGVL